MQQAIAHRGPDGWRSFISHEDELAVLHRRLSIIDLSDSAFAPMFDQERSVMVCANGEIYNFIALRQELEKCGHQFQSHCDTEVLVHGYKQWGIDGLLERVEGMFAFCLYDFVKKDLFLVRDRIGIKPLYFSLQGQILSFASEIKALWQLPWVHKKISKSGVYHYLTYLATPAPTTMFEGVYKIPGGYYIKIDAAKQMHVKQWYNLAAKLQIQQQQNEKSYIDRIRELLRNSIKKRMMSDVPFGVFLSGGIDSSLNVALMSELTDQVKTFTVGFSDGPELNELQWARKVAKRYGTDHHEIIINEADAFNFFQKMIHHQDEPLGDCVCVPVYYVSKLLKDAGVTVVQVGEGSDELFCGYQLYARYLDTYRWWYPSQQLVPTIVKKGMFHAARSLFGPTYGKIDLMNSWAHNKELFYSGTVVFPELVKQQHLAMQLGEQDPMIERFFPGMQLTDSYAMADWYRNQLKRELPDADQLTCMGYLELKHRLSELLLMRVDKMSMATSVEARVPFLDHQLVEFALTIPKELKYHNGETKYILKKAAEGILPHEIIYRKKMGFAAPIVRWFKQGTPFNELLGDLCETKKADWADILDLTKIQEMQQRNRTDPSIDYSYHLWAVQNVLACDC